MLERYVKKILAARVYDVAEVSPLAELPGLSARIGGRLLAKREDLQPVHSFKLRGAYNKMAKLTPASRQRGVITASAGNHAQGVALAARELGVKAHIVMGRNTPSIKVGAVKDLGGHAILHGDTYDDAASHAQQLCKKHGYTYVHPYDDPEVIAGQGTVGMEILNQHPGDIDVVFVPVGGGGLIAGVASYIKYLRPRTRIIGVEAEGSACLAAAMRAGRRVRLRYDQLDLFADGVSVAQIGRHTFKVALETVDDVITVNTDEICAAIKDLFDDLRSIAEPAGALAIAGAKKYGRSFDTAVAIVSGANVNFDRLRHISERAEVGEHRELVLGVTIPEVPGSFQRFCQTLGKRAVTEFNYRHAGSGNGGDAHVYVGAQVATADDRVELMQTLAQAGYEVVDMTFNETAKLHVRHMVGGRSPTALAELLYRIEFPERPGALLKFLKGLGGRFNITLFHYRNHGAAWGRVLVAFEATEADRKSLADLLNRIGYRYWEESANPAIDMFLR